MNRSVLLYLKGMGMGAADVVPGVSGGTIAFISGIYEELLASIKAFGPDTFKALRNEGLAGAWKQVNGNFLLPLFMGIATSILLLVRVIMWLLKNEPVLLWSFFFGLIIASVFFVGRDVKKWTAGPLSSLIIGAAVSYWITTLNPGDGGASLPFFFLAGMLGICAMILPGISGAFILLLLGAYEPVLNAVKGLDIALISVFGLGCVVGLMSFSRILNWMFNKHHDLTVAGLSGFLIGSLNKIWPWKETLSTRIAHQGKPNEELVPFIQENVLPNAYGAQTSINEQLGLAGADPKLYAAIGLCIVGILLLVFLERLAPAKK